MNNRGHAKQIKFPPPYRKKTPALFGELQQEVPHPNGHDDHLHCEDDRVPARLEDSPSLLPHVEPVADARGHEDDGSAGEGAHVADHHRDEAHLRTETKTKNDSLTFRQKQVTVTPLVFQAKKNSCSKFEFEFSTWLLQKSDFYMSNNVTFVRLKKKPKLRRGPPHPFTAKTTNMEAQ